MDRHSAGRADDAGNIGSCATICACPRFDAADKFCRKSHSN